MKKRFIWLTTQKGMTLAELMTASAFSLFLTASVVSFTSFFNNAQYEYQSHVELTNDSRQIIDKMVWGHKEAGVANRRGISEAVSGTIVSSTQFLYTDISGTQHTIRLNSGTIEYQRGSGGSWTTLLDPNGSAAYDATKYTTSLSFVAPTTNNSVVVRVVVGKNILGKWYYGSSSTQVFYRNA